MWISIYVFSIKVIIDLEQYIYVLILVQSAIAIGETLEKVVDVVVLTVRLSAARHGLQLYWVVLGCIFV